MAHLMNVRSGIRAFVGQQSGHYDLAMVAAIAIDVPPAPTFLLFQRHVVSGLTAGAVK
jgi:ABC-type glycerol-3-phosphate transport system permease component